MTAAGGVDGCQVARRTVAEAAMELDTHAARGESRDVGPRKAIGGTVVQPVPPEATRVLKRTGPLLTFWRPFCTMA